MWIVLLACFGLGFGEIDVPVTDGVFLESLFRRALSLRAQRQAAAAVPLETPVQGRARKLRNRGLQRVAAVVQRPKSMSPKRYGDGPLLNHEHSRCRGGPLAFVSFAGLRWLLEFNGLIAGNLC